MKVIKFILFSFLFLTSLNTFSHNPEDFMIAEIERGQMYFENEQIAAEYGVALKGRECVDWQLCRFTKSFTFS